MGKRVIEGRLWVFLETLRSFLATPLFDWHDCVIIFIEIVFLDDPFSNFFLLYKIPYRAVQIPGHGLYDRVTFRMNSAGIQRTNSVPNAQKTMTTRRQPHA